MVTGTGRKSGPPPPAPPLRSLDAGSACAGKATWSSRVTLALARVLLGFAWRRMPELTGHSLEDVERHLRKGAFRPRDFATR